MTADNIRAGEGWQPIETAPRDGEELLLTAGAAAWLSIVVGQFCDGFWLTQPGDFVIHPTHWRPLPEPPADSTQFSRSQSTALSPKDDA